MTTKDPSASPTIDPGRSTMPNDNDIESALIRMHIEQGPGPNKRLGQRREDHRLAARYIRHLTVNPALDQMHAGILTKVAQDLWDGAATQPFPGCTPPFEGVTP